MHKPRNKSHRTNSSDHNNQDQELLVLMVIVGISQEGRLASWGDTDGSCLRGQIPGHVEPSASSWQIPYLSFSNVCPSVTWKLPLLPYHSLWIKHLSMCFDFQLRKGRKDGQVEMGGGLEGWLTLSQRGQLKMLSCVPLPFNLLWEPLPFLTRQEASRKASGHPKLPGRMAPKRLGRQRSQPWQRLLISLVLPKSVIHSRRTSSSFLSSIFSAYI